MLIADGTSLYGSATAGSDYLAFAPFRLQFLPGSNSARFLISLGAAALVMAALALIPLRRVQVATNVLVAIGTVFLAIQLVRIYTPPADPVASTHRWPGSGQCSRAGAARSSATTTGLPS